MRTIVHISDLHFGVILHPTLDPLVETLHALKPDLVIVSGDLTQRAKAQQFIDARAYLDRLPQPQLILPGNHDIPLYDVFRRFVQPLNRYREHITQSLAPAYLDDEIAVAGLNTAHSFTFKGGRLTRKQVLAVTEWFASIRGNPFRIVVTHHPFDIPEGLTGVTVTDGAAMAMELFAKRQIDLFLAGHLHLVHIASASTLCPGYDATIMHAGTATSTRARGEPNSFFVFRIDSRHAVAETHTWDAVHAQFVMSSTRTIPRMSPMTTPVSRTDY